MKQLSKKFYGQIRLPLCTGLALSGCLALHSALAGGPEISQFVVPMTPGVSIAGNFIDFNSGWADALVPVFRTTPNSFLYLDPQGLYHNDDQYSASVGGGFRMLTQSAGILGAYVFGDYNHSQQNNSYWFISPGLERLGDTLDFSVNGYFPVSAQRNNTTSGFASQFGDTDDIFFSGHNEFDSIVQNFESTGVGVDGEVGYRLPFLRNNTKLYLGGYYFSPKDNDSITGGIAKLEVPVNNLLSLTVSDAYDNIFHNTFRAGASLSLWGRSTHFRDHSLETRLVDPVQRNRIAQEGHSGTDQYITEGQENIGTGILLNNIWFFAPGGTPGPLLTDTSAATPTSVSLNQCTAEHPCASADVNTNFFGGINRVAPNAKMFLAPGTYSTLGSGSGFGGILALNAGQSMYGRTADYKSLAVGDNRALLVGEVDMFGSSVLNSLRLANDGTQAQGVLVEDNANVLLYNVLIGNNGSNPTTAYQTGVSVNNNDDVGIISSQINAFILNSTDTPETAAAINVNGSGNEIEIDESTLTSTNLSTTGVGNNIAAAINILGGVNEFYLHANNINVTAENGTADGVAESFGNGGDTWTLIDNSINVIGFQSPPNTFSRATAIDDASGAGNRWTLVGNSINVSAGSDADGIVDESAGGNTWLLSENSIVAAGSQEGVAVVGIIDSASSDTWILQENLISVSAAGLNTHDDGIFLQANSTTWTLQNNQILVSATGGNGLVDGFELDVSNSNKITSMNDSFIISAAGSSADGYGFDANLFVDSASANTITLMGDTIRVNATGNAYGIYDNSASNPQPDTWTPGNNTTAIIQNNNITATSTGGGQACKVTLNGGATCNN